MSDSLSQGDGSDGFDPDARALCRDTSCIGVLGSDGCCKVCGLQSSVPAVALDSQSSPALPGLPGAAAERASVDPVIDAPSISPGPAADADSDDFADRHLCEDLGCIGVLDGAGRCKVCGRVAQSAAFRS